MKLVLKKTRNLYQSISIEDDSQDFQPNDSAKPMIYKGGTLFPGSDDDE